MDDSISRQAAIKTVHEAIYEFFDLVDDDAESPMTYLDKKLLEVNKAITNRLNNLPSAQERIDAAYKEGYCDCEQEWLKERRQKRKRGKWIRENIVLTSNPPQYQWHCSECGRMVHWFTAEVLTDFCPSCGADMRAQ